MTAEASDDVFVQPFERREHIVRTLERRPELLPAQATNLLPLVAALYEPLWRRRSLSLLSGGAVTVDEELATLCSWAEGLDNGRILDLGCSSGLYARTLAHRFPALRIHALDVSLPFLRQLVARSEGEGPALVPVHGDARSLPYRTGVFDAVMSGGTLNELGPLPQALAEQARVLRSGGRLWHMYLVTAENPFGRTLQRALQVTGLHFPAAAEVNGVAADYGLELTEQTIWPPIAFARFVRRNLPG